MTNIDYTLWPNTDGELGKIKVTIPANAEDWPAGDALVGNFIYNDGKLVGFVDTKALILNESATTTFPYDYVDISLPSIQEGTLTIKRGERCKYLNVEMYRADWLPAGFTELEYLESSGTQWIDSEVLALGASIEATAELVSTGSFIGAKDASGAWLLCLSAGPNNNGIGVGWSFCYYVQQAFNSYLSLYDQQPGLRVEANFDYNSKIATLNDVNKDFAAYYPPNLPAEVPLYMFCNSEYYNKTGAVKRVAHLTGKIINIKIRNHINMASKDFVPVLDGDGIPCMFDKVSRKCFYNQGSGTFGYRIKTTDNNVAPLSLRDPYYVAPSGVYAKLIAENELEIVADTEEVQGNDWVHFANRAEAYEHFGITFEDEILV